MSTTYVVRDSLTMVRRNLLHVMRYPSATIMLIGMPLMFLLLFTYVFGGTMGAALPGAGPSGGRAEYLAFITPGILIVTVGSIAVGTALSVSMDMTGGIIARFRTMNIARVAVLTGHVIGAVVYTLIAVLLVLGIATALGYRPDAGTVDLLAAIGLLTLLAVALTWFSVALGLIAPDPETASNLPMLLPLLPLVSSGFVPTAGMPSGLRQFAEHQPFTPVINSVRDLLAGQSPGSDIWWAIGWCLVIAIGGYLWSRQLYRRVPAR
jgi:ABC-2 type transport system permease protein